MLTFSIRNSKQHLAILNRSFLYVTTKPLSAFQPKLSQFFTHLPIIFVDIVSACDFLVNEIVVLSSEIKNTYIIIHHSVSVSFTPTPIIFLVIM